MAKPKPQKASPVKHRRTRHQYKRALRYRKRMYKKVVQDGIVYDTENKNKTSEGNHRFATGVLYTIKAEPVMKPLKGNYLGFVATCKLLVTDGWSEYFTTTAPELEEVKVTYYLVRNGRWSNKPFKETEHKKHGVIKLKQFTLEEREINIHATTTGCPENCWLVLNIVASRDPYDINGNEAKPEEK